MTDQPNAAVGGFGQGFFGCFGVLAALVCVVLLLTFCSASTKADDPRDYLPACALAVDQAPGLARALRGAAYRYGEDPVLEAPIDGDKVVRCPITPRNGVDGSVRAKVVCGAIERACVRVIGAEIDGRAYGPR